jgi:hypothetical protein
MVAFEGGFGSVPIGCGVEVGGMGSAGGVSVGSRGSVSAGVSAEEVQAVRKAARARRIQATGNPVRRMKLSVPALLDACLQPGGSRRVEFGADAWSNIRDNGRFDIAVNSFVDRFISYITKVE